MKHSLVLVILFIVSCGAPTADKILQSSLAAHGSEQLDQKVVFFDFRDKSYSVNRTASDFIYTRSFPDSTGYIIDSLINSTDFMRYVDGNRISLTNEWETRYANSVNSVLYFFQIPYVLNDPAAIKKFMGSVSINGEPYYSIKVTFQAENGGEDFEDEYRYWIHQDYSTIDFLAYNYHTEGGGTRFRQAINRKDIDGLVIQDYINYKPREKFPALDSLPQLFEMGQLSELSRIYNRNVSTANY